MRAGNIIAFLTITNRLEEDGPFPELTRKVRAAIMTNLNPKTGKVRLSPKQIARVILWPSHMVSYTLERLVEEGALVERKTIIGRKKYYLNDKAFGVLSDLISPKSQETS